MKTEIIKETDKALTYPYLGKAKEDDAVVLFTEQSTGVCLVASEINDIGEYSKDWDERCFTRLGSTTIKFD